MDYKSEILVVLKQLGERAKRNYLENKLIDLIMNLRVDSDC